MQRRCSLDAKYRNRPIFALAPSRGNSGKSAPTFLDFSPTRNRNRNFLRVLPLRPSCGSRLYKKIIRNSRKSPGSNHEGAKSSTKLRAALPFLSP